MLLWLLAGFIPNVWAITPDPWKSLTFSYHEDSRDVGSILRALSQAMGTRIQINAPSLINKTISNGHLVSGTPVQILDRLSSTYGFQWFVYKNTIYISDISFDQSELLQLKGISPAQAKQALVGAGLFESKFGWAEFEKGSRSAVMASGPPTYVSLVKALLSRINIERVDTEERVVMVFPLKYASAVDVEVTDRGGKSVRLGVASILSKLLKKDRISNVEDVDLMSRSAGLRMERSLNAPPVGANTIPSIQTLTPLASSPFLGGNPLSGTFETLSQTEDEPIIEAYPALNAVLVKDRPSRRSTYEALFRTLDVATRRVEIVVTIVDVDTNTLDEWLPQISIGNPRLSISTTPGGVDSRDINNVVLVSTNRLSVALRNSESNGNARIQSRPSIMTLDNLSAILDLSQTAYFKLLGERTVDLRSVTVGTRLKVTPRILGTDAQPNMHVQIELEDGALQNALDGETRQSRNSYIGTQAVIGPGHSLLIGGYRRDSNENSRSSIPFLSTLPGVGVLFRSEFRKNSRVERLFVLSTRVLDGDIPPFKEQVDGLNNIFEY